MCISLKWWVTSKTPRKTYLQSLHLNTGLRQAAPSCAKSSLCWTWRFDSEKYKKVEEIRGIVCPCSQSEMYFVLNELLKPLQCQITCVVVKHGFDDVVQNHFGNGLTVCRCLKELIGRLRNGQLLFKVIPFSFSTNFNGRWLLGNKILWKIQNKILYSCNWNLSLCYCMCYLVNQ